MQPTEHSVVADTGMCDSQTGAREGHRSQSDRRRSDGFGILFSGRVAEAKKLCWTLRRSSLDCPRDACTHGNKRGQRIRQSRGKIDDSWLDRVLRLRLRREPAFDPTQATSASDYGGCHHRMVHLRLRFVVCRAGSGMKIKIDANGIGQSRWYEYVVRFVFGGTVTAITGLIAKRYGAAIGGLFLAFPAILPATATLIEKHEKEKKERAGINGAMQGRKAAGVDAAGAAMGCSGLAAFALIAWRMFPSSSLGFTLITATVAWLIVSVSVWFVREKLWRPALRLRTSHHTRSALRGPESSIQRRIK